MSAGASPGTATERLSGSLAAIAPQAEPLYEQVYRIFRARIKAGEWKPQALLPGEVLLAQELGVSVGTVRKAMDQLARDHLILRERGRGTFVKGDDEWHSGSGLKLLDADGNAITPLILLDRAEIAEATPFEARKLNLRSYLMSKARVIRLERTWTTGQLLLGTENSSIAANRFPELAEGRITDKSALSAAYDEAVHSRCDRTVWRLGSESGFLPEATEAETDNRFAGPTTRLARVSFDARGIPIEVCRFEFRLNNCLVQLAT